MHPFPRDVLRPSARTLDTEVGALLSFHVVCTSTDIHVYCPQHNSDFFFSTVFSSCRMSKKEPASPWTMLDHEGMLRALQLEQTERVTRIAEQARLAVHLKRTKASEMQARNAHLEGTLNPRRLVKKEPDRCVPCCEFGPAMIVSAEITSGV